MRDMHIVATERRIERIQAEKELGRKFYPVLFCMLSVTAIIIVLLNLDSTLRTFGASGHLGGVGMNSHKGMTVKPKVPDKFTSVDETIPYCLHCTAEMYDPGFNGNTTSRPTIIVNALSESDAIEIARNKFINEQLHGRKLNRFSVALIREIGKSKKPTDGTNPDLEVGAVHKIRIQRDIDEGPYGIYFSEVKQVFKNFYLEEVSFPKTLERPASKRTICFPIVDHRFGIGSCNLNGDDLDN